MNFRFCSFNAVIAELLASNSLNSTTVLTKTPAVEPFSTILDDAVIAVDALRAQGSFGKTKKRSQSTEPISRRRALRESRGRVNQYPNI